MGVHQSTQPCATAGGPGSNTLPNHEQHTRPKHLRPQPEFLLGDEEEIIRRNWTALRAGDTQSIGIRIFLRIFEVAPGTKEAFESFRDKSSDELMTNVLFRSHSMRFMQAVEGTISNLNALDVIILPNLRQLGKKHTQFHGFHPEYLAAFEQAMDETWKEELGPEYNGKAKTAWAKIFHLITNTVLEGYNETPNHSQSSSCKKE